MGNVKIGERSNFLLWIVDGGSEPLFASRILQFFQQLLVLFQLLLHDLDPVFLLNLAFIALGAAVGKAVLWKVNGGAETVYFVLQRSDGILLGLNLRLPLIARNLSGSVLLWRVSGV